MESSFRDRHDMLSRLTQDADRCGCDKCCWCTSTRMVAVDSQDWSGLGQGMPCHASCRFGQARHGLSGPTACQRPAPSAATPRSPPSKTSRSTAQMPPASRYDSGFSTVTCQGCSARGTMPASAATASTTTDAAANNTISFRLWRCPKVTPDDLPEKF